MVNFAHNESFHSVTDRTKNNKRKPYTQREIQSMYYSLKLTEFIHITVIKKHVWSPC